MVSRVLRYNCRVGLHWMLGLAVFAICMWSPAQVDVDSNDDVTASANEAEPAAPVLEAQAGLLPVYTQKALKPSGT